MTDPPPSDPNVLYCATMGEWLDTLASLIRAGMFSNPQPWTDTASMRQGFRSGNVVVAYPLAAFRIHYQVPHFVGAETALQAYREDIERILRPGPVTSSTRAPKRPARLEEVFTVERKDGKGFAWGPYSQMGSAESCLTDRLQFEPKAPWEIITFRRASAV